MAMSIRQKATFTNRLCGISIPFDEDGPKEPYLEGKRWGIIHNMPTHPDSELRARLAALEAECERLRDQLSTRVRGGVSEGPMLDKAGDGIFTMDAQGTLDYVNATGMRLLGSETANEAGAAFSQLVGSPENREIVLDVKRWLGNPGGTAYFLAMDVPVVNALGQERRLSIHLYRKEDPSGGDDRIEGVARDVTEQHRLQSALRQSEEHYRGIIENMELGILEVDHEERIIRAFPRFCAIVGYSEEELLGKKASDIFMRESDRQLMDDRTQERNAGKSGLYECPIRNKQGEEVWLLISGVPIRNEWGEVVGSMGIHYDITERKRDEVQLKLAMEEAEAARRSERAFLAKVSHEIRTPMNAIIGMSRLLGETTLEPRQQEFVRALSEGARVLKGLLDNVLDIARLEDGQYRLRQTPVRVRSLFDSILEIHRSMLTEKGVTLELEWATEIPEVLQLDRGLLTQVLMNLVGNAAKFTAEGKVVISARLRREGAECYLDAAVEDTGPGIPASEVETVFQRFRQGPSGDEVGTQGSGLGLSIVRELCAAHGGSVSLTSEVGKGSRFQFHILVGEAKGDSAQSGALDPAPLKDKRILVAEDNPVNMMYAERLLKKWGVEVVSVTDGASAVDEWRESPFDLILMDIQMPICDGMEATRRIRLQEREIGKPATGIIGLSAFAFHKDVEDGLEAGMSGYLVKPYEPHELLAVLLRVLQR